MSKRFNTLFTCLIVGLVAGVALAVTSLTARADNAPNGTNATELSNNDFYIVAQGFNGYCDIDYVDQFENNGVYYSTICSTSDIFLNVAVQTRTPLAGNYINGNIAFTYTPTVTLTNPNGFTLSNSKYSVSLVNHSDQDCAVE